ncbi:hypothetical protein BN903_6 [Halorubrum sp. AJ67]|nr:hypothetical protein BN903_6 [Halorubrum sp. AJ67]
MSRVADRREATTNERAPGPRVARSTVRETSYASEVVEPIGTGGVRIDPNTLV